MDPEGAGERPGLVNNQAEQADRPDPAAAIRHGDGDDDSIVLDSLQIRAHAAVEGRGSPAQRSLGLAGRPRAPRLGAQREVLRKPESGLPDPNAAEGLAATGGRPEGGQTFRAKDGRPEAARQSIEPSVKPGWSARCKPIVGWGTRGTWGVALK